MNKLNEQDIVNKYIIEHWTIDRLRVFYKVAHKKIREILIKNNIKSRICVRDFPNENYFENIDTELKAYFVGYILADGCISDKFKNKSNANWRKRLSLELQDRDKIIIDKLKQELNTNNVISLNNKRNTCKLSVTSDKLCNDLINLGITPRKSLTANFDISKIPENLRHHFIRGLFDGDGCISFCYNGKKQKFYKRFDICGSLEICRITKNILDNITQYNNSRLRKQGNIYRIIFGKKDSINKIYNYLYQDATFYLNRKKEKFEKIIKFYSL